MIKQIEPKAAFEILAENKESLLVDVRTDAEFKFVGIVDSSKLSNETLLLPLLNFPNMSENSDFIKNLENHTKEISPQNHKNLQIFFICKTGGRSNSSANIANELGFSNCYNIINGFEGDLDHNNQRGNINGWKAEKLPWKQS